MNDNAQDTLFPFSKTATAVCLSLAQKGAADALTLVDIRAKLTRPVGSWVELTEDEHKLIEPCFRRPSSEVFTAMAILQLEPHIRAVIDAPHSKPAALTLNGPSASA